MAELSIQKTPAPLKPVPKIQATALAGALVTIISRVIKLYNPYREKIVNKETQTAVA